MGSYICAVLNGICLTFCHIVFIFPFVYRLVLLSLCACTPCYCGSMNLMIVMILRHLTCNPLKRQYCQMEQEFCLGSDIIEHSC